MTLKEVYNLPEGANVSFKFIPTFFDGVPEDFPCPSNMEQAFQDYGGSFIKRLDVSNVTKMDNMFNRAMSLVEIDGLEEWDVSNVTRMNYLFYYCWKLTSLDLSKWSTSNVTSMANIFNSCKEVKTIKMPTCNHDKLTDIASMFSDCSELTSISAFRCDKVSIASYQGLFGFSEMPKLTDIGGFIGLKSSMTSASYGLNKLPNLTYESCINILNGLYDFAGHGETPSATQGQLKVHQNFLDKVGDEISIGTLKGWKITV